MSANVPRRKKSISRTQVPEQYWGYSLQAVRFLQLLLASPPSSTVSLEVFEDVGRTDNSGKALASQTKSGLVRNPISDRAVDLWKTLSNWRDAAASGALDPKSTIFEVYVGRKHSGKLASLFSSADTVNAAAEAIEGARLTLWGPEPNRPLRRAVPESIRDYVEAVLDPRNSDCCVNIIRNFKLAFATGNPLDDLEPLVANKWVPAEAVSDLIKYAHGWVKERTDRLIQERKPAVIHVEEFNREMAAFIPRLDFRRVLIGFAGEPSPGDIEAERIRTYVHQLEFIDSSDEEIIEAINAYLRASVMRSKWGEEGIIHEQSFGDFAEALVTFWRNKRRQNQLAYKSLTAIEHGKMILSDCCLHDERLQGLPVPSFFTPGSYHSLADELDVVWHQDYVQEAKNAGRRGK